MKLAKIGILALKGSPDMRDRIREMENVTPQAVNRWIKNNDDILTKAAILRLIKDETGLSDDQLLEDVATPEPQSL